MSPSSLIFVAVIAIWATHLVVHVSRRREQLATARAVARFSDRMRVLQRRAASYTPPEQAGRVSSASLTWSRPLTARPAASTSAPTPGSEDTGVAAPGQTRPAEGGAAHAEAEAIGSDVARSRPGRVRVWYPLALLGRVTAVSRRRVTAFALAVTLLASVVTGGLAVLGIIPGFVPVAIVCLLTGAVVALRARAVAARDARRRAEATRGRESRRLREAAEVAAMEARPPGPELPVAQEHVPPRDVPFDITVFDPPPVARPTEVDPLIAEHGWAPTPVPPPTYTLKARAERPAPLPLEVPVPIEVDADDVVWAAPPPRRVVNG